MSTWCTPLNLWSTWCRRMTFEQCGLIVANDCWSSTFNMVARLLKAKDCQIPNDMGLNSLLPSEWQKLMSLHDLLPPSAEHTKTIQMDAMSMSLEVPALFDLLSHPSTLQGPLATETLPLVWTSVLLGSRINRCVPCRSRLLRHMFSIYFIYYYLSRFKLLMAL